LGVVKGTFFPTVGPSFGVRESTDNCSFLYRFRGRWGWEEGLFRPFDNIFHHRLIRRRTWGPFEVSYTFRTPRIRTSHYAYYRCRYPAVRVARRVRIANVSDARQIFNRVSTRFLSLTRPIVIDSCFIQPRRETQLYNRQRIYGPKFPPF